jgi:hypothetical protein
MLNSKGHNASKAIKDWKVMQESKTAAEWPYINTARTRFTENAGRSPR